MKTPAPATASWVVVPPFHHDAAWRASVIEAVRAAGRRAYDYEIAPVGAPVHDPEVVIITADATQPIMAGAPAEAIAGLIVGVGVRLDPGEDPDALPHHIRALTAQIAQMGLLPPERLYRRGDFAAGAIEILPGIMLQPPAAGAELPPSPRRRALADAVALLDPATPQAFWAPDLFLYESRLTPGGGPGDLDLTGRPRHLVCGPSIALPAGRWRATYRLTFDQSGGQLPFRLGWGRFEELESEDFVPGRPGVFEIVQEFIWTETAPAEIRISQLGGAFDGRMTFSGVKVSRVD
jgi:hypothetical protein